MTAKRGRPPKDKYKTEYMVSKIEQYISDYEGPVPILKECCLLNDWNYDYVMELQRNNPTLSQSIKKLLSWKEVRLEQKALTGEIDKTMAIFSLKQPAHGWSDRPDNPNAMGQRVDDDPLSASLKELAGELDGGKE